MHVGARSSKAFESDRYDGSQEENARGEATETERLVFRRPQPAPRPTIDNVGFNRTDGQLSGLGVAAFQAFERATLETIGTRRDVGRDHPHGALRTARTFNTRWFGIGICHGQNQNLPESDLRTFSRLLR